MNEREKLKKQSKKDNAKPTIGLLMGLLNESSWAPIWSGVADMAREQDVNLICFTGGMLEDSAGFQKQANVLYDLVDVEQLDGLVIWGGIGKFVDPATIETFYKRYQSIPIVSIGDSVADVPSILADNYGGMYQVVTHLVEDHGYHRIAYIKGNENFQEHEERFRAYSDALKEYGLAVDQNLIITEHDTGKSHYNREIGSRAVQMLVDERQAKFEALIVNDDVFAYGVIDELQGRGVHVPEDMPIVGFDDDNESQYITPPLTTVPYPYYELGRQAAETLLAQLGGSDVLERMYVPTRLGIRQSCGCLDPVIEQTAGSTVPSLMKSFSSEGQQFAGKKVVDILAEHRDDILAEIEQTIELSLSGYEGDTINPDWFEQLLDSFGAELSGTPGIFLRELDAVMRQVIATGGDAMVWQNAVSGLRRQVVPYLEDEEILLRRAEDLWQQARVMISDFVKRVEGYKALQGERQSKLVNELGRDLLNTTDIPAMMDVLAKNLPKLGVERCYLSLYQDPTQPIAESRLLLAYDKKGRRKVKEADLLYPSSQLVPAGILPEKKSYQLVVEPLYFQEDQQGFVIFESDQLPGEVYYTLREQISSVLQSVLLTEKRNKAEQTLAQERDLLQSLMDTSFDLIYFKDLESRFIRTGASHARFFGLDDPNDVIGKSDFNFFTAEHAQQAFDDEQQIIKTGQPIVGIEEKETWPDGRITWASTTKMPLRNATGNIVGTFGISRNITEQRNTAQTIAKRAAELQTVAEVSTAALTTLDTTQLLQKVVDLTKSSFDLYHAHIYLLDDITNNLVLAAGAGDVGRKMVTQGWSIPLDRKQSLVARAARNQAGVIVNDVQEEPGWLPNEDLPQTRSELAAPLLVGDRVLGVLDVQSDEADHFTEDDIRIQTTMAAQVAVALENARLFEQAERADFLLRERVKELDCLNDIGREMEENPPPLPELLEWITRRIPAALQHPELAVIAIEFDGQVYGNPAAIDLPAQIVHGLYIGGEILGRIYISYTEKRDFIDEESSLLGGIATRVSGFIENQRLLEQVNQRAVELEQSAGFLDSIIDNIPVTLFVKDAKDLSFVRWNKAGEELLGFKNEEMMGKNDYDFFPKEEAEHFIRKDREVLAGGVEIEIPEEPMETKYKGPRLLHTRKIPVYGPDGTPRYLMGISEDITDRKQAEAEREQLLDEVQRLAAIVENHPDFIGVGTLKGKPLYLNPAGLKMMGLPLEYDVTTMDAGDFFTPEDAEKLMKEGIPTALEQGFWSIEANLLRADGKTVPVEETISINYDTDGNPTSFSITMHDITNRQVAAIEQSRLLAEVESSYRQYVQQEWEQYLQEQHHGQWHIEHKQHETFVASDLTLLQEEVIREQATKVISRRSGNGSDWPTQDTGSEPAAIVSPISLRGQVIGTLNLQDIASDRNWSDEEIALVEAVSEQLALTVENLRLFDDTQRRATREQVTRQITEKMHAAGDVDAIIQTGLTELAKTLSVSRTYVKLSTADERDLNNESVITG